MNTSRQHLNVSSMTDSKSGVGFRCILLELRKFSNLIKHWEKDIATDDKPAPMFHTPEQGK
jgi:hypothetical protein